MHPSFFFEVVDQAGDARFVPCSRFGQLLLAHTLQGPELVQDLEHLESHADFVFPQQALDCLPEGHPGLQQLQVQFAGHFSVRCHIVSY